MSKKSRFKFLEHTADVYVVAYGRNLVEAFENAALATFEVMTETGKVKPEFEETVEVNGFDEKALLYNWLETLLVKFDTLENLYVGFNIDCIQRTGDGLELKARIRGARFDPSKHPQKRGVKAVTYHRMEILEKHGTTKVKFILDI